MPSSQEATAVRSPDRPHDRIRVVLVDDHHLVRQAIRLLIESLADVEVVAEGASAEEALDLASRYRPDILLLDIALPDRSGVEVTSEVLGVANPPRIIMLSVHAESAYVAEAFRRGASGYVLKDALSDELITAIRVVARGLPYLSAALSKPVISTIAATPSSHSTSVIREQPSGFGLTPREREILVFIGRGRTNSEIAAALAISVRTVEAHRANVMRKLGISSRVELLRFAMTLPERRNRRATE